MSTKRRQLSAAEDDPLGVSSNVSSSYPNHSSNIGLSQTPPPPSSPLSLSLPRPRPLSCSQMGLGDISLPSPTSSVGSSASEYSRNGSTGGGGGSAGSRTLVRPRSWRIVPRARTPSSTERKAATQEDSTLAGDVIIDPLREYENRFGSNIDPEDSEVFKNNQTNNKTTNHNNNNDDKIEEFIAINKT